MGIKHIKKIFDKDFQNKIIKNYLLIKSIKKVSINYNITTRQVINILNDNNIKHTKRRKTYLDEKYFDRYNDDKLGPNIMYWAGFIAADGNVINNKLSRSYFMTVNLSIIDINHLIKLKNTLKSTSKLITYSNPSRIICGKICKPTNGCRVSFASKYLISTLEKFNIFPAKSKIYNIPDNLHNHKFIRHFIRGYMDGDGGILFNNKYKRVYFYGTEGCLDSISKIIEKNCLIKQKAISKNRTIYTTQYNGKDAVYLINWLYKDCAVYLERKYNLIKDII